MNGEYNIWNKWDPLKTVMLGDCYGPEFFREVKNLKIKSALTKIADETKKDLDYFNTVLKDFGCNVIRPELDNNDSILNYIDENGRVNGRQGVPRSPLQPRDGQLVAGDTLYYIGQDHPSIKQALENYCDKTKTIDLPLTKNTFDGYCGDPPAVDWPSYNKYLLQYITGSAISDKEHVNQEFNFIHATELSKERYPVAAPCITVVGKDIYLDKVELDLTNTDVKQHFDKLLENVFANFRCNSLKIGGHNDACFHTLKPGAILSLYEIQEYNKTFPGWDVCYLSNQGNHAMSGFLKMKNKVAGKWWVPDEEDNDEFTYFVETWLQDWVGYVEETVFDVNVLVLDEHHVCVNNMNPVVIDFLKKHHMEPVYVPWRHRYFWDGGLHCITLDLHRQGNQKDLFPDRTGPINDLGFD
jgi:hypothetical protein